MRIHPPGHPKYAAQQWCIRQAALYGDRRRYRGKKRGRPRGSKSKKGKTKPKRKDAGPVLALSYQQISALISMAQLENWHLTRIQAWMILDIQGWACAVCREPFTKQPFIDHDHETNNRRSFLCHPCNCGLGHFRDNPEYLRLAAAYLEAHRESPLAQGIDLGRVSRYRTNNVREWPDFKGTM